PCVTERNAQSVFELVRNGTITSASGVHMPIPHEVIRTGCEWRAVVVCELLRKLGYEPTVLMLQAAPKDEIGVTTPIAPDVLPGALPKRTWPEHLAPVLPMLCPDGQIRMMVFDASLADRPLTVEEWRDMLTDAPVESMSYEEALSRIGSNGQPPANT